MSLKGKQWIWPDQADARAADLAREIDIPPALARLLLNRGFTDPAQAGTFLQPSADQLHSPWLMLGMECAVSRLLEAISSSEKIIIHGDYDADGITASVILVEAIRQLGGRVDYFLPSRFEEGYGLHIEPLTQFKEDGTSLVVTVDCGINAAEEIAYAAEIGLDLIITDHHQPLGQPVGAVAVINPLQKECPYPFKELSGAGIAFKLAAALMEKSGERFPSQLLDLAALGTAADVVPLLGENRVIVSLGLDVLCGLRRAGFKALAQAVRLDRNRINSTALSFILAPAINAAGRMGEALPAARLLLEKNGLKAAELAEQLNKANQKRRSIEQVILKEAEEAALELFSREETKIITLAAESWHHGVIGIVASRLVEKFNRPVVLVALEDETGRGSARSVPGFDITAALAESAPLLERFGGHEQAAGFTVENGKIEQLRDSLNNYARLNLDDSVLAPRLQIDAELAGSEIGFDLTAALDRLQPFGTANPMPLFGLRDWEIDSWRLVGSGKKHLKLSVRKGGQALAPIMFAAADLEPQLEKGRRVDLAFRLKNGFFREQKTLEVELKDINYSDTYTCGSFEVIDLRGSENRLGLLKEALAREQGAGIVFSATLSRANWIRENCPDGQPLHLLTSGAMNGGAALPADAAALMLYELPLHEKIIEPILKNRSDSGKLKVYLLYNDSDQEQNCKLTDLSLPSAEVLETIVASLLRDAPETAEITFPGSAGQSLTVKPAESFWERVEKILVEIKLLEKGRLSADRVAIMKSWPECLGQSPTYLAAMELLDSCEHFQRLLLDGSSEEIAAYLHDLSGS